MSTHPQRISKYELRRQLGRVCWVCLVLCCDLQARREVAVKLVHPDLQSDPNFLTHFVQVGQKLVALRHEHLVQIHEVNILREATNSTTIPYIVMDYIDGPTLADYIRGTSRIGKIPSVAQIVYIFTSLALAIDYAHEHGVVHGNIKPGNVLLNKFNTAHIQAGEPMLVDSGMVQILDKKGRNGISPLYCSPEQALGDIPSGRSDVYSLGVMLYEICTGVQPFHGDSPTTLMMQQVNTLPTPPTLINPNIPAALSSVILRAMSKDPAARYGMASLLAAAIADACAMPPTMHLTLNRLPAFEEPAPRNRALTPPILGVSTPVPDPIVLRTTDETFGKYPVIKATTSPLQAAPKVTEPQQPPLVSVAQVPGVQPTTPTISSQKLTPATPLSAILPNGKERKRRKSPAFMLIALVLITLLIIGGSVITANVLLQSRGKLSSPPTSTTSSGIAGHVFFQDDALGRNDNLRIELSNIAAPPAGKNYQAWLATGSSTGTNNDLWLGALTVAHGNATFNYAGDANHTNLLSIANGFYLTLEDNTATPSPAPGSKKVFEGTFDPTILPYLRNILVELSSFPSVLPTRLGLVAGLFETIKSINEKGGSMVDDLQGNQDYGLTYRQTVRIIEMIDGTDYAHANGDLPANLPSFLPKPVPAGLISSPTQQGYIDALAAQIVSIKQVSAGNASRLQYIQNIQNAITDLKDWVEKIRSFAVQMLKVSSNDPALTSLAQELKKTAADAYTGHIIPPDTSASFNVGSAGAQQAYVQCQYLATLDILPSR